MAHSGNLICSELLHEVAFSKNSINLSPKINYQPQLFGSHSRLSFPQSQKYLVWDVCKAKHCGISQRFVNDFHFDPSHTGSFDKRENGKPSDWINKRGVELALPSAYCSVYRPTARELRDLPQTTSSQEIVFQANIASVQN